LWTPDIRTERLRVQSGIVRQLDASVRRRLGVDAVMDVDLLDQVEAPVRGADPDALVRQRAEKLIAEIDDRERLFELRSLFILRLHRRSDDFGASEGLRVVERAIAMITPPRGLGARQPTPA
jgi:hypothetical protein